MCLPQLAVPLALAACDNALANAPRLQVGGEKVVVKVQRPGLKELFDIDLKNVRVLAQLLQKVRQGRAGRAGQLAGDSCAAAERACRRNQQQEVTTA